MIEEKKTLTEEEELELIRLYEETRDRRTRKQKLLDFIYTHIIEFENYLTVSETIVSKSKESNLNAVGSQGKRKCVFLKDELISCIKNQFNEDLIGHFGEDNNIVRIDSWDLILFDQVHSVLTPKMQKEAIEEIKKNEDQ